MSFHRNAYKKVILIFKDLPSAVSFPTFMWSHIHSHVEFVHLNAEYTLKYIFFYNSDLGMMMDVYYIELNKSAES